MRLKCIACEALARPAYLAAARSPHIVEVELVAKGLHNTPNLLRNQLQAQIEAAGNNWDAILLIYGLCGKATAGLTAGSVNLVIPRAHDCITLFLGSRARYTDQFNNFPGTYWFAQDYMERGGGNGSALSMGSGMDADLERVYDSYVEKYGRENADYLMEAMGAWQNHYKRAVFLDIGLGDGSAVQNQAREQAERRGWEFERIETDLNLVYRQINGQWDDDFLIVHPGQSIEMTAGDDILGCSL
jgi:hypothetical protein